MCSACTLGLVSDQARAHNDTEVASPLTMRCPHVLPMHLQIWFYHRRSNPRKLVSVNVSPADVPLGCTMSLGGMSDAMKEAVAHQVRRYVVEEWNYRSIKQRFFLLFSYILAE